MCLQGRKRAKEEGRYETGAEKEALANYEMLKGGRRGKGDEHIGLVFSYVHL